MGESFSPIEVPAGLAVIKLEGCKVAGFRADLINGVAKLTFSVALDDQVMDAQRWLSWLGSEGTVVDLRITEQQMRLPFEGAGKTPTAGEVVAEVKRELGEGVGDG